MSYEKYVWYWLKRKGEVCVDIYYNKKYHNTIIVHTGIYTDSQFKTIPKLHRELCRTLI